MTEYWNYDEYEYYDECEECDHSTCSECGKIHHDEDCFIGKGIIDVGVHLPNVPEEEA